MKSSDLVNYLRASEKILIFTGAGISTASGIPDFRGPSGIWKTRKPVYYQEFLASEEGRVAHWEYKLDGWESYRDACPNAVHDACFQLEQAGKLEMLVTQNIDGLHSRAGTSTEKLVEVHGTNSLVECQSCYELTDPQPHFDQFRETRQAPRCHCGGYLKIATISFGQSLREEDLRRAAEAAEACDLVVALGSTLSVYPAASIPLAAAERGVPYVIINMGATEHDNLPLVSLRLEGDVVEIFPPAVSGALGV
jgi:NAD-dependent deacetylase